ncbi:ABC transporter permease [Microbacterium betulae]|uniref:ABC transporter permease n=1 Tax=Microbacterium betulae TaxID=2981139 RepID=A0AA97FEE7_9MICO|nr:ABC transporter permease [Microbacterium sp. AB]WOF21981.1 ABC transporter permease [Microbacterium sp. AB]
MSELLAAQTVTGSDPVDAPALRARGVWQTLRRRPLFWLSTAALAILTIVALIPGPIAALAGNPDPRACKLSTARQPPSAAHLFGTDAQGCDLLANVLFGTRTSLFIGLTTTAVTLVIALVLGTVAGYSGGWADALIARLTDVFLGFPFLLAAIVVLTAIGERTPLLLSLVLALFSWPTLARLVRGSVRTVRESEYVQAATAMGLRHGRVVMTHVLPNALGPVLAIATTMVGSVIVAESTLTFLGVGLVMPSLSWGLQLSTAQTYFQTAPHMLAFPAAFLTVTVVALIMLGDILRDALDPKGRS